MCVHLIHAQNPQLIKQVNGTNTTPGESGSVRFFKHQVWNGKLFYSCNGTNGLCVTDGTNAGTQNIFTFTIPAGSILASISFLGPAQDFMYIRYRVQYPVSSGVAPLDEQIWRSDGTAAGTQLVFAASTSSTGPLVFSNLASDPSRPASIIGNTLFFRNITSTEGGELWKTDGTPAGTVLVKDIRPGTTGSSPVNFGNIGGGKVLFYAGDGIVGRELWITDGTDAGTVLVKDINPDNSAGGSSPNSGSDFLQQETGVLNGKYFFYANTFNANGAEPWVSDGTAAGTFMLKDIAPGSASSNIIVSQLFSDFMPTDKYMFFRTKNFTTVGSGAALWRSDGTVDGTIFLSAADSLSNTPAVGAAGGDKYVILFNNGLSTTSARQYYLMTDGTPGGTNVVDTGFFSLGNPIIYKNAAWSGGARGVSMGTTSFDNEVFRTDGTRANSRLALDVFPGVVTSGPLTLYNSATPQKFFTLGNDLYFFARNTASPFWGLFKYTGDFTFNNSLGNNRWSDSTNWNSMLPPGVTDTAHINAGTVNIDGRKAYAGRLEMQAGTTVNLVSTTDSLFISQSVQGTNFTGNGVVVLRNFNGDTVRVQQAIAASNVNVVGNASITGNLQINNNLRLSDGARLFANNNNVILAGLTSTINNSNSYIVTNGTGALVIQDIGTGARTGTVEFPIGTTANYNPLTINNTGAADQFSVRVSAGISSNYIGETPTGGNYTTAAVDATWFINEAIAGGSSATLGFQWNAGQELPGFDRTQSRSGHYTGGTWIRQSAMAATGSNPYSITSDVYTSFSPFGVLNNNVTLPITKLTLTVQKTAAGNQCSWVIIADDAVSISLERSTDGSQFASVYNTTVIADGIYQDRQLSSGTCFYRIKAVTVSGAVKYSNVVWIAGEQSQKIAVYPTFFTNLFTVQNNTAQKAVMMVQNVAGIKVKTLQLQQGTNLIDAANLGKGIYFYQVLMDGEKIAAGKLLKQ